MRTKKHATVDAKILARARRTLAFAKERAKNAANWMELHNALFAPGGKATELFSTEAERTAFCRTQEYKQILALSDTLSDPPVKGFVEMAANANGAISVRLLAEAKAEGVSLNQLCQSKLVAQLRAMV